MTKSGQETSEVRQGHQFNEKVLGDYLAKNIQGFKAPIQVRQFNVGQSNPTFLVIDATEKKFVVRKKPSGQLLATAHMIEREYQIIKVLKSVDFPVPYVYLLCEDTAIIGTSFYVMEFIEGRIFTDVTLASLSPQERKLCYEDAVRTLAKLHSLDFKKIGLTGYGKHSGFYERQIKRMSETSRAQIIPGKVDPLPHSEELLNYFSTNMPEDVSTIVHGDFKFDNIIFHPKEPRVIGVLDWEMSTIGHPMSDLANLCLPYHFSDNIPPPMQGLGVLPDGYGIPEEKNLHKLYCEIRQIPFPIKKWEYFVAFSFFRAAVILQGIGFRAARGQASNPMAEIIGQFANVLADDAWTKSQSGSPSPKL